MKKGPFKMNPGFDMLPKKVQDKITKKTPAKHTGGNPGMIGSVAGQLGGRNSGMNAYNTNLPESMGGTFKGALGMLGGRKNSGFGAAASAVGGNKPSRGNMLGALSGAINFPSVTGGGGRRRRNKRRGMGALNAFRNRIRGIFG